MKKQIISVLTSFVTALPLMGINAFSVGYGQGTAVDENNCPTGAVEFNSMYCDSGTYSLTGDKSRIIITFDQGYENGYTSKILDTLKEKNVSAIFFLTGDYAKKEKALVRRMIDEGHVLGNHGMTHAKLPDLSPDELKEEVMSLHQYVLDEYGYEMQYFRYPCGEYSEETIEQLRNLGYKTLFWSFAYVDWKTDSQPSPDTGFKKLTESAHGGEILLLHSVSATNAEILGDVIDCLREKGFKV
ncbi:MAG: polysaccharide deacetylase family protein [Ruminococcus sp.]|nr:polysaccharide deacetylase family protein [Oscillospiraceae bacterium]MDY4412795.1 polysaccharide deacetylase family protein [Ruminococcus sp.]